MIDYNLPGGLEAHLAKRRAAFEDARYEEAVRVRNVTDVYDQLVWSLLSDETETARVKQALEAAQTDQSAWGRFVTDVIRLALDIEPEE